MDAELAVIGAALAGSPSGVLMLDDGDFDGRHRVIAAAIRTMVRRRAPVDPITVGDELAKLGKLGSIGGSVYLHDLHGMAPAGDAGYYAAMVRERNRRRAAQLLGERLTHLAEGGGNLDEFLSAHRADLDLMPKPLRDDEDHLPTVADILATEVDPEDWLIPGLIEHQERIVITGSEGGGKTTLLKQLAACVAAGLHPWTGNRVADGKRVLYVDAELSQLQNRRAYLWIQHRIRRRLPAEDWEHRLVHLVRNDGLDLAGRDREWFHHVAAKHSPDLIVIGPVYKLINGDESDPTIIAGLQRVLDEVRVKHNAALIIEAHSPHGGHDDASRPVRPVGSSLWLRWPEIGFGFRRDSSDFVVQRPRPDHLEVVAWRGQRDERDWPDLIRWGSGNEFPWVPTRPDYQPSVTTTYTVNGESA